MNLLLPARILCPYCGEPTEVLVDTSESSQEYIEDCSVCCRPMVLRISCVPGEIIEISAGREDDC